MTVSANPLSDEEISEKFSHVADAAKKASLAAYEHCVVGANLGLDENAVTWETMADESRAYFGVVFEQSFKNFLGAKKLPKETGLDIEYLGLQLDVKTRQPGKDIQMSMTQKNSLMIVLYYDMKKEDYSVYAGYPCDHHTSKTEAGKFSLASGQVKKMVKLAEGSFKRPSHYTEDSRWQEIYERFNAYSVSERPNHLGLLIKLRDIEVEYEKASKLR
jgi:hypothetical protein